VASFVQFANKEGFTPSYAPQSGEIFGILEQMKETFEKDLGETQKSEEANQKAYEEVKAAKMEQIAAGQAQVDKKTQELADTDERLAHSKQDIEDTKNSLSADEKFLMDLKERCKMTDSEWETRSKTRALEMESVSKALAILSSDEVHNLFTRTFDASLAQLKSGAHSGRREQASLLLSRAASRLHSPRLSSLALRVKLDAFTRVKKAIDDMVAALLEEKAAEIKHKDFCVKELDENQMETEKKEREKQELEALIDTLESTIKDLTDALNTLKAEIADLTAQIKVAGEDREKENMEFQKVLADQRETQKVLAAAQAALASFYGEAKLLQQGPAPPAGFDEYKKSGASAGVMDLIKNIITDAKAMEAETTRDEEDAQKAYEDFVKASNDSIEAKKREITAKSAEKAKAEGELVEAKENKGKVMTELEQLSNMNAQLHSSCDFILKNFELRQTARDEEVQALRQAKDILSGSHFDEFLQVA
jgi:chromosome segregation ATPase